MPKSRQTTMTSATFPESVQFLAQDFLKDYTFVAVGRVGAAASTIQQKVLWVEDDNKDAYLFGVLLALKPKMLTLIFCNQKTKAVDIERFLVTMGLSVAAIHGDLDQGVREQALKDFKNGRKNILVATDVAARGLDIPDVALVEGFCRRLSIII